MVFVDSNIFCYYFNKSSEEHEDVAETLDQLLDQEKEIHVNTVVLMEVAHFLIKNLGGKKGKKNLKKLLNYNLKVTDLTYSLTLSSIDTLELEHQSGIGGRDATIISSMKEKEINELVTHDQAFKRIDEIEVIDPVK